MKPCPYCGHALSGDVRSPDCGKNARLDEDLRLVADCPHCGETHDTWDVLEASDFTPIYPEVVP